MMKKEIIKNPIEVTHVTISLLKQKILPQVTGVELIQTKETNKKTRAKRFQISKIAFEQKIKKTKVSVTNRIPR